jgi:hypothetical protein
MRQQQQETRSDRTHDTRAAIRQKAASHALERRSKLAGEKDREGARACVHARARESDRKGNAHATESSDGEHEAMQRQRQRPTVQVAEASRCARLCAWRRGTGRGKTDCTTKRLTLI